MNDSINEWVHRAKAHDTETPPANTGVKVIRKEPHKSHGMMVMEIAEKLFPALQSFFKERRDAHGALIQPAHVRGFALNYAEYLVKAKEQDNNAAA